MAFLQTNERWKKEVMSSPDDFPEMSLEEKSKRWKDLKPDTLGRWGCIEASIATIIADFYSKHKNSSGFEKIDPLVLNRIIRENKGYWIFTDLNNSKDKNNLIPWDTNVSKECPIGSESFLNFKAIEKIFNFYTIDKPSLSSVQIESENRYWIARVPFNPSKNIWSGHYNVVVNYDKKNKIIKHFDTDSGAIRTDWGNSSYYWLKEIIFKKTSM